MQKRAMFWLAAGAALVVAATRWPFRSHALYSWDSANFALAMADIDIAAHRPHPPGYIGYVLAARALDFIFRDPNLSLVVWNIAATALAAAVLVRFAWELADEQRQTRTAVAAALIFTTSPLIWFYGEIAEIYASELLATSLVAFTAWRTIRGHHAQMYWCAAALAVAAFFKMSAAIFLLPLVIYAWTRVAPPYRWKSAAVLLALLGLVAATFLALQPDLPNVVWDQVVTSTSGTRMAGGDTKPLRALNRNVRDAFTATVSGLGVLNLLALVWIAVFVRRLPQGLGARVAVLWAAPWLVTVIVLHLAKPGYILPVIPLAVFVIAAGLARLPRALFVLAIALQAFSNVIQFAWLSPPSNAAVEEGQSYRNKSRRARMLSDLQAITEPTAFSIQASDQSVSRLRDLVSRTCPSGNPIIIAELEPVDWRRVMWYFPAASAVRVDATAVISIATGTDVTPVTEPGVLLTTECPVIWLHGDHKAPGRLTPPGGVPVPGVGVTTAAGSVLVMPSAIRTTTRQP
jgi:hypothetical protein